MRSVTTNQANNAKCRNDAGVKRAEGMGDGGGGLAVGCQILIGYPHKSRKQQTLDITNHVNYLF